MARSTTSPSQAYQDRYALTGDPNGLKPIIPTIAPLTDSESQALPYLASNDITAFSILDTETQTVSSYCFDTRNPDSEVLTLRLPKRKGILGSTTHLKASENSFLQPQREESPASVDYPVLVRPTIQHQLNDWFVLLVRSLERQRFL